MRPFNYYCKVTSINTCHMSHFSRTQKVKVLQFISKDSIPDSVRKHLWDTKNVEMFSQSEQPISYNFTGWYLNLTWYSAIVHKFTRIYSVCSTYELTKQFKFVWKFAQSISKNSQSNFNLRSWDSSLILSYLISSV